MVAALAVDLLATHSHKSLEVASQEIAQRKQAEEREAISLSEVKNSEKRFHALIEHGRDNISLLAADGTLLWESPTVDQILGYTPNQFLGRNIFELIHPNDLAWTHDLYARVVQTPGSNQEGELRLLHADGTWRWIEYAVTNLLEEPSVEAIVLNFRDVTKRKQAEDSLQNTETRYRRMVETANEGVIVLDRETRMTLVNQQVANMLGYTIEELLGQKLEALFFEDDIPDHQSQMALRAQGQSTVYERCFRHKDGGKRWTIISATATTDAEGRFDGAFGMLTDITERKTAEAALQESERMLRQAQEIAHIGHFKFNPVSGIVEGSDELFKIFGLTREEFQFTDFVNSVHPEDRAFDVATIENAIVKETGYEIEHRLLLRDGTLKWVRAIGQFFSALPKEKSLLIGTVQDITERTRTVEALRESESRYRTLFQQASDGIFYLSTNGQIVTVNKSFARMHGYSVEEMQGMSLWDLDTPDNVELITERMQRVMAGEIIEFEADHYHKDGHIFPLAVSTGLISVGGDHLIQAFHRDITERRRAEEALRESEQKHRRLFESMSQGVIYYNASGTIISANPAAEKILGMSLDQLQGKPFVNPVWKLVREDGSALLATEHPISIAQRTGKPVERHTLGMVNPNTKATLWLSISAIPLFNSNEKEPYQVYSTFEDITERKRAENALKLSEDKFAKTFRMNPSVMVLARTKDGRVTEINDTFTKIFGYTHAEIIDSTILEKGLWVDPEDRGKILSQLKQGSSVNSLEVLFRTRQNRIITCSSSFEMLEIDGELHILAVLEDITERKLDREKLLKSEALFRAVVEHNHDGIVLMNAERRPFYVSPSYTQISGFSPEEWIGAFGPDFVHPDDREIAAKVFHDVLQSPGKLAMATYRLRHKMGHWFWVETNVTNLLPDPVIQAVVLNSHDITERKLAEDALRESNNQMEMAQLIGQTGSWVYNLETGKMRGTVEALRIFGFPPLAGDFSLADIETCIVDRERVHHALVALVNEGREYDIEYEIKPADGSPRKSIHSIARLQKDARGTTLNVTGFIQDITGLKRAEEDRIAREIAEQANRAKSEFLSRMSHELRTPLNAILGFAQLLKMDELGPDQARGVDQIYKSGRHLLNLVNQVLDIARIESGKMHISPEPVRLAEALQETIELIRPLAEARRISIRLETPTSPYLWVQANPQSFRQVLLNLLSNAVKYNREDGEITITTSLTGNGHLRLQVQDTGEGIPPDKMERLFVPFDRLDRDLVEQEGTGLGLALSKGLVEAMGGRIGALSRNRPGEGSIFWLELVLVTDRTNQAISSEVEEHLSERMRSGRFRKQTGLVLYVEDNLDNLRLVEAILARLPQVELITAMQGRLALDLAKEHHPNLILLDLHLPDMPGLEVLRQLKARPATENTPVIILSANAMPRQIEELLAGGALAFLTKPIDIPEFLKVVDEALIAPRLRDEE